METVKTNVKIQYRTEDRNAFKVMAISARQSITLEPGDLLEIDSRTFEVKKIKAKPQNIIRAPYQTD